MILGSKTLAYKIRHRFPEATEQRAIMRAVRSLRENGNEI